MNTLKFVQTLLLLCVSFFSQAQKDFTYEIPKHLIPKDAKHLDLSKKTNGLVPKNPGYADKKIYSDDEQVGLVSAFVDIYILPSDNKIGVEHKQYQSLEDVDYAQTLILNYGRGTQVILTNGLMMSRIFCDSEEDIPTIRKIAEYFQLRNDMTLVQIAPMLEKPIEDIVPPPLPDNYKNHQKITLDEKRIEALRKELQEDYIKSGKSKKAKKDSTKKQEVLNVAWYDENFEKISSSFQGEWISIVVLTKGYEIGEKIEVTIGEPDEKGTLMEGVECKNITFIGTVNYENLAVLQNLFTTEGEKEYVIINPNWKDKYRCE